jgi:hypothetical protein
VTDVILPLTIVLNGERPISWNKFYSGRHWAIRKKEKDRVRELLRTHLTGEVIIKVPVNILIVGVFNKRPLDSDNICDKLYIDGLKEHLLTDDDIRYVHATTTISVKGIAPKTIIILYEASKSCLQTLIDQNLIDN